MSARPPSASGGSPPLESVGKERGDSARSRGDAQLAARRPVIDVWRGVLVGDLAGLRSDIDGGFDVMTRDCAGRTVLHAAVTGPAITHTEMVRFLVDLKPALVNVQDDMGQTALHLATHRHNTEALLLLMKGGAIVNVLNAYRQSPLDVEPSLRNIVLEHIESAPTWVEDGMAPACQLCGNSFTALYRRHHCRHCGRVICDNKSCSAPPLPILKFGIGDKCRVCSQCAPVVQAANDMRGPNDSR